MYLGSTILDTVNGSNEIGDGPAFLKKNSAPIIEVQTDRGMIRITFRNEFRRNITAAVLIFMGV